MLQSSIINEQLEEKKNININSPLRHCSKLEYQHIFAISKITLHYSFIPAAFGIKIMRVFFNRSYVNINTDAYADQIRLKNTLTSVFSIIFTHHLIPHFPETVPPLYLSIITALYHILPHVLCPHFTVYPSSFEDEEEVVFDQSRDGTESLISIIFMQIRVNAL